MTNLVSFLHVEPGGPPNRPVEIPVIDDPGERVDPKPIDTPPVPDPPEIVGFGYSAEEHYYHAEWWHPASWQPHA